MCVCVSDFTYTDCNILEYLEQKLTARKPPQTSDLLLQEILGREHPTTVRSREDVIIILQNLNRHSEANELLAQQPQSHSDIA